MPKKGCHVSEETRRRMREGALKRQTRIVGRYGLTLEYVESQLAAGNVWCSDCKRFRVRECFGNGKRLTRCKECANSWNRKQYTVNKVKLNAKRKVYYLANIENEKVNAKNRYLRKYGIDRAWYDAKLEEQAGGCAICGVEVPDKTHVFFNVDHNHKCCQSKCACEKCRRGLLCFRCNTALERLESIPDWTYAALSYLAQHGSKLTSI